MRRLFCTVLLIFAVSYASPLPAMDMILGAKSGYFIWKPYFEDIGGAGFDKMTEGSGVLYGPVVSILFTPDLSLSAALLTGKQSAHWQAMLSDYSATQKVSGNYQFDVTRADLDSALSYQLADNFKLFAGYKYFYLKFHFKSTEVRSNIGTGVPEETNISTGNIETPFHGPALGIGFSQMLGKGYFVAANISATYMWGYFQFTDDEKWQSTTAVPALTYESNGTGPKLDMKQLGLNIEPAVGINLGDGMPIITLGFRYQYLRLQFIEGTSGSDPMPDDWLNDHLYGAFVSVMYLL